MEKSLSLNTQMWLLDNPNELISIEKWQLTVNLLAKLFNAPAGFLVQHTQAGFQVTVASDQTSNPYPAGTLIEPEANIFCKMIVETKQQLYVANALIDPVWDTNLEVHNDGFVSYLGVPVFWPNGETFGTFCVMDYKITDYQQTYIELINQLKDILESDLSLIDMYQQAQQLAITDALTNIHNRRGFQVLAEQRIRLAKRVDNSLGLFYFDVDQFKKINDLHGHSTGDEVLKVLAKSLQASTRGSDVIGRIGGDEFVALVSIEAKESADCILERFNQQLAQLQQQNQLPGFSVSAGYTDVDCEMGIKAILEVADQAMLAKKKSLR